MLTKQDQNEFKGYLRQCTDKQVQGVYTKEKHYNRKDYVALAETEAARRGIELYEEEYRYEEGH